MGDHGWNHPFDYHGGAWHKTSGNIQAFCHIQYYKLILIDPNGIDDRDDSNFIVHSSIDFWLGSENTNTRGISRYKRVTNDWVAHTFTTQPVGLSKEQFVQMYADLAPLLPREP